MSWAETIIELIDTKPWRFRFVEDENTSFYTVRINDIDFNVYRTGVRALFNGTSVWESTDRNHFLVLFNKNKKTLRSKLKHMEEHNEH